MTQDVLELVRRSYEAMNQAVAEGNVAAFVRQAYDPDIVMEMGALEGTIRGLEGVQRFIEGQAAIIEGLRTEPEEVIVIGDRLLIAFRLSGTARSTGLPFEVHYVHLVTMREGKAVHVQLYTSKAKALEAIG